MTTPLRCSNCMPENFSTDDKCMVDGYEIIEIQGSCNYDDVYIHLRDSYGFEFKGEITGVMDEKPEIATFTGKPTCCRNGCEKRER